MFMNVCGIDVSKNSLEIVTIVETKVSRVKTFANTRTGHKALVGHLKKLKVDHVCMEATGNYHLDIALILSAHKTIKLMVINPKVAHSFGKALAAKAKTDAIDACVLAQYALRMEFKQWQAPPEVFFAVRACSRRLYQLVKLNTKLKNQLHSYQNTDFTPEFIIDDALQSILQVEQQIKNLIKHTLQIIEADEQASSMYQILININRFGPRTAIKLVGEIGVLDPELKGKQLVAHAGLYPTIITSGTSVNKKSRLSKTGNKYIREALYMSAMSLTQHNENIAAYYQHLINDNGLAKRQAICAIMRKLLLAISCMLRNQSTFDPSKFYHIKVKAID
jgi:transposase